MNQPTHTCPCCGGALVRHIRHRELYWFCLSCRQEVPLLTSTMSLSKNSQHSVVSSQQSVVTF